MEQEDRMLALEETLKRVATFATVLSEDGISIRFLNYDDDKNSEFDNLTIVSDIEEKFARIQCVGDTKLGTILNAKIVEPMILSKAREKTLRKPVIVVIITDGDVRTT